jgi:predicted amidophosphoribosyltransferase
MSNLSGSRFSGSQDSATGNCPNCNTAISFSTGESTVQCPRCARSISRSEADACNTQWRRAGHHSGENR